MNPLIIHGKIIKIENRLSSPPFSISHIQVNRILKNELNRIIKAGDLIKLKMPTKKTVSLDIIYQLNQEGIWILEEKEGIFLATYPKDFQPLVKQDEISVIILKQEKPLNIRFRDTEINDKNIVFPNHLKTIITKTSS